MVQTSPTSQQQTYLSTFIAQYTERTRASKATTQTYRSVLADPRNTLGLHPPLKELCYPIIGARSSGSRIWDVDGNEYIDTIMGFGVNLLGHNPDFIKQALEEQLEKGIQLGPQAEFGGEVAALISELTGMERVAISNTGTEAVMTAIRLARAATGRSKIALFSGSYHGHFDGTLARMNCSEQGQPVVPMAPGIPASAVAEVLVLDYGNLNSLEIIQRHAQELAAVLVEPIQSSRPNLQPKAFLHELRALTQAAEITLVFDEMVSGFRLHLGGAQAWFGVEADIATYGKVVGGGMPIGIVAGKASYLDRIDGGMWQYGDASLPQVEKTVFAGTHCKHPLSMAAARAMLRYLKRQGPGLQAQLNQRTSDFVLALNAYFEAEAIPIHMASAGSLFGVASASPPASVGDPISSEGSAGAAGLSLLSYHLRDRSILLRGNGGFLSTAHTQADLDRILQAVKDSIQDLRHAGLLSHSSDK